jgi:hypothetical protein
MDHLSPVIEGFENPTMATLFREMLTVNPSVSKMSSRGPKTAVATSKDGSCPPASNSASSPPTASGSGSTPQQKIAFLKSILNEQKATADSLMESAKNMGPVSQKLVAQTAAYDAAFESDVTSPMPNISGTLQGFSLFFFILSFFSLAIVSSIMTNHATGSTSAALKTFGMFLITFIVAIAIIIRIG